MAQSPFTIYSRENFPVAGWFLPVRLRAAVRTYYAFARTADDVADDMSLTSLQKLNALDMMDHVLHQGYNDQENYDGPWFAAFATGALFQERNLPIALAADLLMAFRVDALNTPPKTFDDLMAYCRWSAVPVGRFLLALHGQTTGQSESDALCTALQLLNHVQDARSDADNLKRSYIPHEWSTIERHNRSLQRMLDQAERLLSQAGSLPIRLSHRGLSAQSAMIIDLSCRLLLRLRRQDPWHHRVKLKFVDWLLAAFHGLRVWILRA